LNRGRATEFRRLKGDKKKNKKQTRLNCFDGKRESRTSGRYGFPI